jgi:hypothetical protein
MKRELKFAGDVQINSIILVSLNGQTANIENQVVSIEVYEDMLSPFTTLSLVIKDSLDFINLFPFVGEEYLKVDIVTPGMDKRIKGKFYIYKIVDRMYMKDREVIYTIRAASEEFLTNINTKITKPLTGKISDTVTMLMGREGLNTEKSYFIEETSNKTKMTANFWDPVRCVNALAQRAVSVYGSPSYMFFEGRNGFMFKSINTLLTEPVYTSFTKDNYSRKENAMDTSSTMDVEQDYKRITNIDIPVLNNYIDDIQSGQIKSRIISHDMLTKKYTVKDYSVKKDPNAFVLINKSLPYSKYAIANASSKILNVPKYYGVHNGFGDTGNTQSLQRRMSFFKNLEKYKVQIEVAGRTDYTVGMIVDLNIPKISQITKEDADTRDLIISGKYLVSAMTHYISRSQHTCKMELVKNSLIFDLGEV